jgi:acyl transferase domain-containing protein/acyl carrier protein
MSQEMDYKKLMTQALQELQLLRSRVRELETLQPAILQPAAPEPIAIIGMGCRLPGEANSPAQFWQNLSDEIDAITPVPSDRWPTSDELPGINQGGFIGNLQEFDAAFFGIAPKEAISLDPQQRLLLEIHWEALEQAGIVPGDLAESNTGIFIGMSSNDYSGHLLKRPHQNIDAYLATGNSHSTAAGRIAFTLGLQGPAIAVDTACSSSLVAVHLACQSLRQGECDLAIASGVNRILAPEFSINFARANMLSPDGRCKTFDVAADGFGRAEGAGAIVLKRLSDVCPTDQIFAVIRGSAVNQDGRSSGLTVPNGPAQQRVIQQALKQAGLNPEQVDYLEAHGTGTALGDPIELGAIQQVFGRDRKHPLIVGSAKTNLGHLEAAAGIAGLIKTALILYHRQVPPHLHFQQGNPKFDWQNSSIKIPTHPLNLSNDAIAGVSSLGFSGTNAHVILASTPVPNREAPIGSTLPQIFTLSAKSPAALQALKAAYQKLESTVEKADWANISIASRLHRTHFDYRDATLVTNHQDAIDFLTATPPIKSIKPKIAFLFTGQGSQYSGMGKVLYETQPIFKQQVDRCADLFQPYLDIPLVTLLFDPVYADRLDQTQYTQPVMFTVEYALAKLWETWGIKPDVMLGHSLGEYVAAHLAGVFSLEDAIKLVGKRARLMQELPQIGKMVMVEAPAEQVRLLLASITSSVEIAAINSHNNTVISGNTKAIDQCLTLFSDRQIHYQSLKVSQAFHSALMDIILIGFQQTLSQVKLSPPQYQIISDYTGELVGDEMATIDYWCRHLRHTVQYKKGIETLANMGCNCFIEIGAKSTLINLGQSVLAQPLSSKAANEQSRLWLASLSPQQPHQILSALTELYRQGVEIEWSKVQLDNITVSESNSKAIAQANLLLPTYPFQRQRYWIDSYDTRDLAIATAHPLLGHQMPITDEKQFFAQPITPHQPQYLADHVIFDHVILPGAAYLELAIAAIAQTTPPDSVIELQNIQLQKPVELNHSSTIIQTALAVSKQTSSWAVNSRSSISDINWLLHAKGDYSIISATHSEASIEQAEITANQYHQKIESDQYYQQLAEYGIVYGRQFQAIQTIWYEPKRAIAQIKLPSELDLSGYWLHPVLLDACFQAIGATLLDQPPKFAFLPIAINQINCYRAMPAEIWAKIELSNRTATAILANVTVLTKSGEIIAKVIGLRLKAIKPSHLHKILDDTRSEVAPLQSAIAPHSTWQDWLYQTTWQPQARAMGQLETSRILPSSITTTIAPEFTQLLAQPHLPAYSEYLEHLENASVQYIVNAFINLGFSPSPRDRFSCTQLVNSLRIQPQHQKLFQRLLEILVESGYLRYTDQAYQVDHWPSTTPITCSDSDRNNAETTLLDRCGSNLAAVLQGEINPLQLLFPNGDWSTLTQLYQQSPGTQITNQLVQRSLLEIPQSHSGKLRILEIGAGTGGTTAHVLPALTEVMGDRYEYTFTDISPIFLTKAKQRFATYPQVKYALLNIEKSPASQTFESLQFDVVIAANALHATEDLDITAQHIQQLLNPGGHLLLVEGVKPARWLDLIFGLTEGWWRFSDRRTNYPLIPVNEWKTILQNQGFSQVEQVKPTTQVPVGLDQQAVIISQKPLKQQQHWLIITNEEITDHHSSLLQTLLEQLAQHHQSGEILPQNISQEHLMEKLCTADRVVYLSTIGQAEFQPSFLLRQSDRFLRIIQALTHSSLSKTPQLILVAEDSLAASSLLGIGKVAALEHPQLCYRSISLANLPNHLANNDLVLELLTPSREIQVKLGDQRQVQRLGRYDLPEQDLPKQLTIKSKGSLGDLQWQPMQRRSPAVNEVEIAVKATGLNLIDVLDALNLLPFERDWFGVECAGEVVAVGSAVHDLQVGGLQIGDRVIALAPGSFQEYVTVPIEWVVKQPDRLNRNHNAAATIPANFLTAYYSLHEMHQLKAGDRVLIHSAASGTGMAAVQIAQWLGAEVYATASPSKWEALRQLGVQHIFNSRDLSFADEIVAGTIDVVFNALSGEYIPKSLSLLKSEGYFIEIGKRGIWTTAQMTASRPDVNYQIVDLMTIAQSQPQHIHTMLQAITHLIQTEKLQPLPQQIFPQQQVVEAFRTMQQAQHVGKIVISHANSNKNKTAIVMPDHSYLITGGFGGLGIKVAQWLRQQGARHIILVGHRPPSEPALHAITELQSCGTEIQTAIVDICDVDAMAQLVNAIELPLDGVFHAAGQLDDSTIQQLTPDRLHRVMAPKVLGAWHLHQLTQNLPLRYFVCFSSAASLLGSPGQANHVAANAFLDAIAQYRQQLGLPAISINWGAWSDIGAAAQKQVKTQMAQRGISEIPPNVGIDILEQLIKTSIQLDSQSTPQVGVIPINWTNFPHQSKQNPFFQNMQSDSQGKVTISASRPQPKAITASLLDQIPKTNPTAYLVKYLQAEFAQVLGLNQQRPDPNLGFFDMGMDSLMTVELQNRLESAIGQKIATSVFFEHPTITALANYLAALLTQQNLTITGAAISGEAVSDLTPPPTTSRLDDPMLELPNPPNLSPPDVMPNPSNEIQQIEQELAALEALLNS